MATDTKYVEDPDFVPNPTDVTGTLDTSGTAGDAHGRIEEITPIFDIARAADLEVAAKALDPNDDSVHSSLVTLPTGAAIVHQDPDKAVERVKKAARAAKSGSSSKASRSTESGASA